MNDRPEDPRQPLDGEPAPLEATSDLDAAVARARAIGRDGTLRDGEGLAPFSSDDVGGVEPGHEDFAFRRPNSDAPGESAGTARFGGARRASLPSAYDRVLGDRNDQGDAEAQAASGDAPVEPGAPSADASIAPVSGAADEPVRTEAGADMAAEPEAPTANIFAPMRLGDEGAAERDDAVDASLAGASDDSTASDDDAHAVPLAVPHDAPADAALESDVQADAATVSEPDTADTAVAETGEADAGLAPDSSDPDSETIDAAEATGADGSPRASAAMIEVDRTDDDRAFAPLRLDEPVVEAPVRPKPASNRGVALVISLLGTVLFAVLFLLGFVLLRAIYTEHTDMVASMVEFAPTAAFYVPVCAFGLLFVLWSVVSNRAGYGSYAIAALFGGIAATVGYHVGVALQLALNGAGFAGFDPLATLTDQEHLPAGLLAALIAVLVIVWFGTPIAARGRRLTARARVAGRRYEQELDEARNEAAA